MNGLASRHSFPAAPAPVRHGLSERAVHSYTVGHGVSTAVLLASGTVDQPMACAASPLARTFDCS